MKKICFLIFALLAANTFAQDGKVGLGIILGEPTGLSAKIWTGKTTAFDAAAAWSFGTDNGSLHLHADFLKHKFGVLDVNKGQLPLYFGLGAKVVLANDPVIGVRVPLGISYIFADGTFDTFLEVVPVLNLIPSTDFDVDAAIGLRYYF
jgi:hypothetical protein